MDKTQADPRLGAILGGRYRITTLLGEGGMGLVYRGERLQLGRPVAIKFLHGPYAQSPKFVARFEREARAMSKLSHPHCVSVIDFGVQDAPYIVMDFVTGSTLRDVLDEGRLSPARALSIVRQVLFGLAHAHAEGVVHRDIKPGNIMLGELTGMGDHVRIFDFGLAKLHDSAGDGDMSAMHVVGTPAYMAPEQARADKIDARVDLYATGVLLFEMLSGQKPFQGEDAYTVLCMQRDKAPPLLRSLAPQLSPELEALVSRALEKDVDKRFQSAAEFIAALDAVPEATGRASIERELDSQTLGLAKTEHQLRSPVSEERVGKAKSDGSLAGTSSRDTGAPRRNAFWLWMLVLMGGIGSLVFFVMRDCFAPAPAPQTGEAEPAPHVASAEPERAVAAAHEPTQQELKSEDEPAPGPAEATEEGSAAEESSQGAQAGAPAAEAEPTPEGAAAQPQGEEGAAADEEEAEPEEAEPSEAVLAEADEALNETDESEVNVPEAPAPAVVTMASVQALLRQGKLDDAINGLRALRKKMPKNASLPYMLGDIYFDRGWWSDGLAKYREAIRMNRALRGRVSVQRNAIRALGDARTYPRARTLLLKDVGRAAAPRLRKAAKSDPSKVVRKRASSVLARL